MQLALSFTFKMNRLLRPLLCAAVVAPAVFLFFAIQYSAITVPFWDHCELGRLLIRIHDQGFELASLWAPHNQHRPLTYRAVLLVNALLTGWDIRSEYIYLMGAMYGAFLLQAFALWRAGGRRNDSWYLGALAILAIFSFSPVGHNNHWWSFMIPLHFAHLFLAAALLFIAVRPSAGLYNVLSSAFCWLAAYSLSNGLIAFFVAAAISQYASREPWRLTRRTIFWIANIVTVLAFYLPGVPHEGGSVHPGPVTMIWFVFVYLGFPLVSLIRYPFTAQFEVPVGVITPVNGMAGILLCALAAWLAWTLRDEIRERTASALCFIGFVLFALGSALLTAWGRAAFDSFGVANANSSRYVLFSSYLIYGILYLLMSKRAREALEPYQVRLAAAALVCFIALAGNAYAKSINVYRQAHEFNKTLIAAYAAKHSSDDGSIYPNPQVVAELKDALRRLAIGPYYGSTPQASDALQELAQHSLEDTFHINGLRQDPVLGTILFAHPRSRFVLPLSRHTKTITFSCGISGGALLVTPKTDGVEFRLLLQQQGAQPVVLWSRYLDPAKAPADRDRLKVSLELHASDGGGLIFETAPGRTYDADWAYWADVVLRHD